MDKIEPVVRLPVDPEKVTHLTAGGSPLIVGGVRVKTTIYVVAGNDLGGPQTVTTVTVPQHALVELRVLE